MTSYGKLPLLQSLTSASLEGHGERDGGQKAEDESLGKHGESLEVKSRNLRYRKRIGINCTAV